jgi:hypothetical protein
MPQFAGAKLLLICDISKYLLRKLVAKIAFLTLSIFSGDEPAKRWTSSSSRTSRGKTENAGRGSETKHYQKVCFLPSLLPPFSQLFATKGCMGERRGDSSGFTVTATYTWPLGLGEKSQGLFSVTYFQEDYTIHATRLDAAGNKRSDDFFSPTLSHRLSTEPGLFQYSLPITPVLHRDYSSTP